MAQQRNSRQSGGDCWRGHGRREADTVDNENYQKFGREM